MTIKLRSLLKENNILVPRNLEDRGEKRKQIDLKRVQEYIENGSGGSLDLDSTPLTKLPDNLVKVGGSLYIQNSSIEDLNNLEYVGGYLRAYRAKLKTLPSKLTQIERSLDLIFCPIEDLNNLEYVGGNLLINGTNISELPEGLEIRGTLYCCNTPLSKRFSDRSSFKEYLKERNITVKVYIIFK